jgi:hypothetical protein
MEMTNNLISGSQNSEEMVSKVESNPLLIEHLIAGLDTADSSKFRYAKALTLLSLKSPTLLYPYFNCFVRLLDSRHQILKWNAIKILSNLVTVDAKHTFDSIFDKYYNHLWDGDLITSANIIGASIKILISRTDLQPKLPRNY